MWKFYWKSFSFSYSVLAFSCRLLLLSLSFDACAQVRLVCLKSIEICGRHWWMKSIQSKNCGFIHRTIRRQSSVIILMLIFSSMVPPAVSWPRRMKNFSTSRIYKMVPTVLCPVLWYANGNGTFNGKMQTIVLLRPKLFLRALVVIYDSVTHTRDPKMKINGNGRGTRHSHHSQVQ